MIHSPKINLYIIFLLFPVFQLFAQDSSSVDIFGEENTAKFARFLVSSNQYKFAAQEYERLIFSFPEKAEYQTGLLRSYRLSEDYSKGIVAYNNLHVFGYVNDVGVQQEYIKLNLLGHNTGNLHLMLGQLDNNPELKNNLDLTIRLVNLQRKISLEGIDKDYLDKGLLKLYDESFYLKHRSPFLAGTFSAMVPGLGKAYSGRWKDGLVALIFIGGTTFQAYRGFNKKGVESVYGWIMGGVSLGFYLGNIYGSVKTAKNYNAVQRAKYVGKVTDYYIGHF